MTTFVTFDVHKSNTKVSFSDIPAKDRPWLLGTVKYSKYANILSQVLAVVLQRIFFGPNRIYDMQNIVIWV